MDISKNFQLQTQLQPFKRLNPDVELKLRNVEKVTQKEYTIDEILDSVENGDVSILKQLNISFTEIDDGSGCKKISFKYNGVRYTVNIISKPAEDDGKNDDVINDVDNSAGTDTETNIKDLKTQREEYQNKLNDIEMQIRDLVLPVPPNASDYRLNDGSIDEKSYRNAMQNYQKEQANYEQKMNELNKMSIELFSKLQLLDHQIEELELKQRTDKLQEDIDTLKQSPNSNPDLINALEKQLEFVNEHGTDKSLDITQVLKYQMDVRLALSALVVPTPPNSFDFRRSDGSIDEYAYSEAMRQYENDTSSYDMKKQNLEDHLLELNNALRKLELEESVKQADVEKLEKNTDVAKNIQKMLDNTPDNEENKALIASLKDMLASLAKNVNEQTAVLEALSELEDRMRNEEVPTPPSWNDFDNDEEAYAKAFEQYEQQTKEYDKKMSEMNNQSSKLSNAFSMLQEQVNSLNFNSFVAVVDNKVSELRANGNNEQADALENKLNNWKKEFSNVQQQRKFFLNREKVLINRLNSLVPPAPPQTYDYLNDDGSLNENDYKRAFDRYEIKSEQFDRLAKFINNMLEKVQTTLKELDTKEAALQDEVENLV